MFTFSVQFVSNTYIKLLTCFTAPTQFMIYSRKNLAVRLLPDTADCPEAVLPIQGLKSIKAIDFDPVDNFLYWVSVNIIVIILLSLIVFEILEFNSTSLFLLIKNIMLQTCAN